MSSAQIEKFQGLLNQANDLKTKKPFLIETDTFLKIWNLYHYAILNLLKTNSFRADFKWMSGVLGLKKSEVEEMWTRLLEAKMIEKDKDGKWVRTHPNTTNIKKTKVAPAGYKDLQVQILNEAIKSLFDELSDRRDHSAITIPIDSKRIPDAREKIAQFRKEMTAFMATENPDQVYTMSIALFPLTKLPR